MKRRAVVFDLDDTLYPEWQYVLSGYRAVAAELEERTRLLLGRAIPRERTYDELVRFFTADHRSRPFDLWLAAHALHGDGLLDSMVATYRDHRPSLWPFADARWVLGLLGGDYALGLLTDGRSTSQRNKIEALSIGPAFDQILVSEETGLGAPGEKPGSQGFAMLLERMRVDGENALYVADNPEKDFIGARRLGMATVRVRRPCGLYRDREAREPGEDADVEISTLFALPELVPELLGADDSSSPAARR